MIIELFYACSVLARLARRLRQEIGLDPPLWRDGAEPHWGPRRAPHFTAGSTFRICLPLAESVRVLKNAMRPQPNAWFRSTIRSSGSSIPTEMRISVGVIPSRNRSSSGMSECVIAAGCEASVSVPPRLTASLITLSRSRTAKASATRRRRRGRRSGRGAPRPQRDQIRLASSGIETAEFAGRLCSEPHRPSGAG
jgi:hypothetical protein